MSYLARALAWFVPEGALSADQRMRARTFVMVSFGMAVFLLIAAAIHMSLSRDPLPMRIAPGICFTLVCLPFALRITRKLEPLAMLAALAVAVGPIVGALESGLGVHAPIMMVTIITPALAAAIAGCRGALVFGAVSLVTVAVAYLLTPSDPQLLADYPGLSPIVAMALAMLSLFSGYFSWLFERERQQAHQQLADSEQRYRELADQLAYQASHDGLTGVKNRLCFDRTLDELVRGERPESFALVYIDLDRFKPVNDQLGHEAGDVLLTTIARRIAGSLRAGDMVFRLGGDEFAALLPGADCPDVADHVTARIVSSISEPVSVVGYGLKPSVSVGVALFPYHGNDASSITRAADDAMYRAKRLGGGRAVCASMRPNRQSGAIATRADAVLKRAENAD